MKLLSCAKSTCSSRWQQQALLAPSTPTRISMASSFRTRFSFSTNPIMGRPHRTHSFSSSSTTTTPIIKHRPARSDIVDMTALVHQHGVRLTDAEFTRLRTVVDANRDGLVSRAELARAGKQAVEHRATREVCLSVIELPNAARTWDRLIGQYALRACDVGGTLLYAVAGTQVAGDAGMNIVGCTLVGCATALGGGTLNNLLYGTASPLHGRPGVFWVRFPEYLYLAAGASLLTFFLWPWYCQQQADAYLKGMIGEKNKESSSSSTTSWVVTRRAFLRSCKRNPEFLATLQDAMVGKAKEGERLSAEAIFDALDTDHSGTLDRDKLRRLTQQQFDNSFETYVLDTLALASFAVAGAHAGIRAGVPALVAASAGVTICFGGIVRDVLCGRSIAIGAQSYAFATGAGATVYVALREAAVRGWLPSSGSGLVARILLAAGTTMALRVWEHQQGRPLLAPMHGRPTAVTSK